MITFEAVNAGHGDAIIIRYFGDGGYERIMLIDGGPKSAGDVGGRRFVPLDTHLVPRLAQIKAERDANGDDLLAGRPDLHLDLVACTHIDDDHIAGIERLYRVLSGVEPGRSFPVSAKHLWFNSYSTLLKEAADKAAAGSSLSAVAVVQNVAQGEALTQHALAYGAQINGGVAGGLVSAVHTPREFGPARIVVVNPGERELAKLKKKWIEEVEKKPAAARTASVVLETIRAFPKDTTTNNLSSIVMFVEVGGATMLLTGDQRGDLVLAGLESAGIKAEGQPLHVNLMKVPHHGAVGNNQRDFHANVTADIYVFSANGKDQNPDPPVLEMIAAQARQGRKFTMGFTNGDMRYALTRGKWPVFTTGREVKTLQEAIAVLCEDPMVRQNVTFEFRDPALHSLCYRLPHQPGG